MELRVAVACLSYKSTAATQSFLRVSSEINTRVYYAVPKLGYTEVQGM